MIWDFKKKISVKKSLVLRINLENKLKNKALIKQQLFALWIALKTKKPEQAVIINLRNNHLDTSIAQWITYAIIQGQMPQRVTLQLEFNQMDDMSLCYFSAALASPQCPPFLGLHFNDNKISGEAMAGFREHLDEHDLPIGLSIHMGDEETQHQIDARALELNERAYQFSIFERGYQQKNSSAQQLAPDIVEKVRSFMIPPQLEAFCAKKPIGWQLSRFWFETPQPPIDKKPAHSEEVRTKIK